MFVIYNGMSRLPVFSPAQPWIRNTSGPSFKMPQGNHFNLLGLVAQVSDSILFLINTMEGTQSMMWSR